MAIKALSQTSPITEAVTISSASGAARLTSARCNTITAAATHVPARARSLAPPSTQADHATWQPMKLRAIFGSTFIFIGGILQGLL